VHGESLFSLSLSERNAPPRKRFVLERSKELTEG
jgi:hypothetical protein